MSNLKMEEKFTSESFKSQLNKIYSLKENSMFSVEEYTNKKFQLIIDLINKGISQSLDDFLSEILILKENNILNVEEIKQIKNSLTSNNIQKDDNPNENISKSNTFYCGDCKSEIELSSEEIKNNKFICPNCSAMNSIECENNDNNKEIHTLLKKTNEKKENNIIKSSTVTKYKKNDNRRNKIILILILIAIAIASYIKINDIVFSKKASGKTRSILEEKLREESKDNIVLIDFENESVVEGKEVTNFFKATVEFKKDGWTMDDYFDRFYLEKDKPQPRKDIMFGLPIGYENSYKKQSPIKPVFYKKGNKINIVGSVTLIKSDRSGILWEDQGVMHTHEASKSDFVPF